MASEAFRKPHFPWCSIFLVLMVLVCQICVLVGNFRTATVMDELGKSTRGWSRVGLGVARSLKDELDETMNNVSLMLLDGVRQVSFVQEALDGVLSLVGNTTDAAIAGSPELSLLQREGPAGLAPLREGRQGHAAGNGTEGAGAVGNATGQIMSSLTPVIMKAVHNVLEGVMDKVSDTLVLMLKKIKPALLQVGKWMIQFGDKVQAGIDAFSVTLDKVQKLFDQVMSQLKGRGRNETLMLDQTFALFDVTGDGSVSIEDLREVANLYSITALQGDVAVKLMDKYDSSGDRKLSKAEMRLLVSDPSIPNAMSVILRTYARRLAEVSGNVAAARQRDEVAYAVVQYFQLVCAKNMTKVGWVAERLGNRSLPQEFTADVMVQLCLTEDDPNKFTATSIGELVIGEMYRLHPRNTLEALDLLSNTTFWAAEGFDLEDQPVCLKRATAWVTGAANASQAGPAEEGAAAPPALLELAEMLGGGQGQAALDQRALEALPETAERLAEESVALHLLDMQLKQQQRHASLFQSETSKMLLEHLLGGAAASAATRGVGSSAAVEQAAGSGQLARPETLEFARWLAYNATANAKEKQQLCFDYSSESSSAMDSFATQIQGMVSQVQGFIDMMMRYATPAGIDQLEDVVQQFADRGMQDVIAVVEKRLVALVNTSGPQLEVAIHSAAHKAGEQLGRKIGEALKTPLGEAMVPTIQEVVGGLSNRSNASDPFSEKLGMEIGKAVADLTSEALAKKAGDLLDDLVNKTFEKGVDLAGDLFKDVSEKVAGPSLTSIDRLYHSHQSRRLRDQVEAFQAGDSDVLAALETGSALAATSGGIGDILSGVWHSMVSLLRSLANTLPTAISTLKFARREVSKLSSNLDSIFDVFEDKGHQVFSGLARHWRSVWLTYFFCLLPLNILILYYAFWAGGFFGGPMPIPDEDEAVEPPKTLADKLRVCASSCMVCMQSFHDTSLCFWSAVIFMQAIVIVIFLASVILCILAGIKAFVLAGCGEVYVLADDTICTEAMATLRTFLSTFFVTRAAAPLDVVCDENQLLTCGLIKRKMVSSTTLTVVFSLLAALCSLQMIIDSAILHEQARWRRMAHAHFLKEAAVREDAAERSVA